MRKLIIILISAFLPAILFAQDTPLTSLYDSFAGNRGFKATEILPGSTSFKWEKDMESGQVKELMQDIESIRVLQFKNKDVNKNKVEKTWKKMVDAASDGMYTEIISVHADDVTVYFYIIKGIEGTTNEVAMLEKDESGAMMVTMSGHMDFSAMFKHENMQAMREIGEYFMEHKSDCKDKEQ
jgi:hypothetical protein